MSEVYVKTQKVSKARQLAIATFLHVSVQVKAPDGYHPAMRTPQGKGATARKQPEPKIKQGQARRHRQRLMRLAAQELVHAAL